MRLKTLLANPRVPWDGRDFHLILDDLRAARSRKGRAGLETLVDLESFGCQKRSRCGRRCGPLLPELPLGNGGLTVEEMGEVGYS